ncbi:hypothetical protein AVEN_234678-1 [Araneus ventricosus]|uniref:Uncharacterized protein n=1 Tax=Araneus ventricosus TaxID=182803 RepID=A0A4Y2VDZ0_ARAVE|nr:hypothetical protein AVEN_234678-1 [Araneus ventricosus]
MTCSWESSESARWALLHVTRSLRHMDSSSAADETCLLRCFEVHGMEHLCILPLTCHCFFIACLRAVRSMGDLAFVPFKSR